MNATDYSRKYCIIGAGAAGLTAAKNLGQFDIPFDIIEREDDVGGNWYYGKACSSIYDSIHLITSKPFTEYTDFPLPKDYPTYINRKQALEYLRSYACAFDLLKNITFNCSVEKAEPVESGKFWDVTLSTGETRRYRGLVVANGHLWDPTFPEFPGRFGGLSLHSSEYKTPAVLRGKRVLVVGAGNSGCDIAVEASQHAAETFHSMRRGYYFWPKYLFGMPSDEWAEIPLRFRLPVSVRRLFGKGILKFFSAGDPKEYGLPDPDHKLFEAHYVINSTLLYHLGHGDIKPVPDVRELAEDHVVFKDGSRQPIDVIIYATGFKMSFPFIDRKHLNWTSRRPNFYLNIFHPTYDNLFLIGLFQTSTGNWPLMDYQSQLVSRFIHCLEFNPRKAQVVQKLRSSPSVKLNGGIKFLESGRHILECEHFSYRAQLKKLVRKLDVTQRLEGYARTAPWRGAEVSTGAQPVKGS